MAGYTVSLSLSRSSLFSSSIGSKKKKKRAFRFHWTRSIETKREGEIQEERKRERESRRDEIILRNDEHLLRDRSTRETLPSTSNAERKKERSERGQAEEKLFAPVVVKRERCEQRTRERSTFLLVIFGN